MKTGIIDVHFKWSRFVSLIAMAIAVTIYLTGPSLHTIDISLSLGMSVLALFFIAVAGLLQWASWYALIDEDLIGIVVYKTASILIFILGVWEAAYFVPRVI